MLLCICKRCHPSSVAYCPNKIGLLQAQSCRRYPKLIATECRAATAFWPAEGYHQQYLAIGGRFGYPQSAERIVKRKFDVMADTFGHVGCTSSLFECAIFRKRINSRRNILKHPCSLGRFVRSANQRNDGDFEKHSTRQQQCPHPSVQSWKSRCYTGQVDTIQ